MGGESLPKRHKQSSRKLSIPKLSIFENQLQSSGDREISSTMAFVRILSTLIKNDKIKQNIKVDWIEFI